MAPALVYPWARKLGRNSPRARATLSEDVPVGQLLYRLLIHVIRHSHRNGLLLFYQLQSELFFHCLENRDTAGFRRPRYRSCRLVGIRSLRRLQLTSGRPANREIPATLKTGGV